MHNLFFLLILAFILSSFIHGQPKSNFPFYEDYLKNSDFRGFLKEARTFLEENPEAPRAPRLSYDYMMAGKAASDIESVKYATNLLLFRYTKSLPGLNFISSFDKGSPRLIELLKAKAEQGNLASKDFAVAYCRAIIFIARVQGPDLLKDRSLRLRAFLLAEKAGVEEILSTTTKSLKDLTKDKSNFGKVLQVSLGEAPPIQKVKDLANLSGRDARFCQSFFLSQLNENEVNSESMLLFRINEAIFSRNPQPKGALKLIQSLEPKKRKDPEIEFLHAISLHFDGQTKLAIEHLKRLSGREGISAPWEKITTSYANGLEYKDNRQEVLAKSIGKAIEILDKEADALFFSASIEVNDQETYQVYFGTSKSTNTFEVQIHLDNAMKVAYRTVQNESFILGPNADKIISFKRSGALPIPQIGITREAETGGFNYNFNLNFSSSFEEFKEEGSNILDNPYLGTSKGRDVLLSHIFQSKPIWLGPAQPVTGGTAFPIWSFSKDDQTISSSSLTFDLIGNLKSIQLGAFNLNNLELGGANILASMPKWPKLPEDKKDQFDFPLFMKILGDASQLFQ